MQWFIITNCQNVASFHHGILTKGTQCTNELDLITELLGTYKKDLKIQAWVEVQRFLATVLELIMLVRDLPLDTCILTNYYRTMSCCQIVLFKSETVTKVEDIQMAPDLIDEWFLNSAHEEHLGDRGA
jgi:hypothetical protein